MSELAGLQGEEAKIFNEVDAIISRAATIGDPLIAFEYGIKLRRGQEVQGLALAKLLYRIRESWGIFTAGGVEDDFMTMVDVHMGVPASTANKYINMWERVFENPMVSDDIKRIMAGKPIGELLLLTAAVGEGSLSGDELKAAVLGGKDTIREAVERARGGATSSKNAIKIMRLMKDRGDMKAGTIYAKQGNEKVTIGFLPITDDELADKAITRIINAAGVIELF